MKTKLTSVLVFTALFLAACGSGGDKKEHGEHEVNKDSTTQHVSTPDDKNIKTIAATYTNIDAKVAASLKEIVDHYLHIKNALANGNGSEAAIGARAMQKVLRNIDKSFFTADQKKIYEEDEDELKEHTEHIGKKADDIKHQREHFSLMSEVVYDVVKSFGGGQPLYHDHCPMFNKDKGGAMWLSETKEIKNPYFGSEMPKCGSVEEIIK
jgi:hypothetical protein